MMARNGILLLAAAALVAAPLVLPVTRGMDDPFAGADGKAADAILAQNPDYRPWFAPLWQPPSKEIESLLFALQAALGAGLAGYYFGCRRGRQERGRQERSGARGQEPGGGNSHAGH